MDFQAAVEVVGQAVDAIGVAVIVIGSLWALSRYGGRLLKNRGRDEDSYVAARRSIGRSVLLGLELLVAADIIRTVAVSPTFESVGVLAAIVVVRTFLSFTLEVEISSKWPWQKDGAPAGDAHGGVAPRASRGGEDQASAMATPPAAAAMARTDDAAT